MKSERLAFGIDIGGTNTKIGLFDLSGKLISYHTLPTATEVDPATFIERVAQASEALLFKECGKKLGDPMVTGVGAGAPMANYFSGQVESAPNLGWKNVPLKKLFREHFKCAAVIENDANLAALGEKKWGAGKDLSDFVLVTLGTGVGTGLILENHLYRGHLALGGEGGHMPIPHTGTRPCSCGGFNHLESYLSAKGIKQTIHELTGEDWTIEQLGKNFRAGDARASTVIRAVVDELVSGLVSMSVLLGPQAFIIGGGVSKLGESFNAAIESRLNEIVHYSLQGKLRILAATLSAEKGAIYGGAALIFHEVEHGRA